MDPLSAARAQMAVSLGFPMVFAASGIALPLLMLIAEGLWLRTGQAPYRDLARTWGKATAARPGCIWRFTHPSPAISP
jgi:cytochrome bd ubiquinol oxidase subunit I